LNFLYIAQTCLLPAKQHSQDLMPQAQGLKNAFCQKFTPSFQPKGELYMKIQTLLKSIFSSAIIALLLSMMSCDTATPQHW